LLDAASESSSHIAAPLNIQALFTKLRSQQIHQVRACTIDWCNPQGCRCTSIYRFLEVLLWHTSAAHSLAGFPDQIKRESLKEGLLVWRPSHKAPENDCQLTRQPSTVSTVDSWDCLDSESNSESGAKNLQSNESCQVPNSSVRLRCSIPDKVVDRSVHLHWPKAVEFNDLHSGSFIFCSGLNLDLLT
jgi:hypothetical protein